MTRDVAGTIYFVNINFRFILIFVEHVNFEFLNNFGVASNKGC